MLLMPRTLNPAPSMAAKYGAVLSGTLPRKARDPIVDGMPRWSRCLWSAMARPRRDPAHRLL
jgi:hypothetical protein